ncbi:MAG: hypothetical protein JRD89_17615, partial [Deltaproteobacteria bacterium]|nr:hypothetical protein [Deltaproteobacteria bacterium]
MARPFTAARIGEMVWPELAAVGALCIGHVVIRAIDAAFALDRPFRRVSDWGHVFVLGTTAYCVATDRAPDVSKAMFYANMGLLGTSFGDWLYQRAVGPRVAQIRA